MLLTILYPYQTGAAGKRKPSKQEQQQDYDNAYQAAKRRKEQRELIQQAVDRELNKKPKLTLRKKSVEMAASRAEVQQIASIEDEINRQLAIEYHLQQIDFKHRENEALAIILLMS